MLKFYLHTIFQQNIMIMEITQKVYSLGREEESWKQGFTSVAC